MHPGQVDPVRQGQRLGEDLPAADHEGFAFVPPVRQCSRLLSMNVRSGSLQPDNRGWRVMTIIDPPGERSPDRLERLPPHDDGVPQGERLEPAQVGGEMPRQGVPIADHAVLGDGHHQGDGHTATLPGIWGCGS